MHIREIADGEAVPSFGPGRFIAIDAQMPFSNAGRFNFTTTVASSLRVWVYFQGSGRPAATDKSACGYPGYRTADRYDSSMANESMPTAAESELK
jgi:hypothetical protein